MMHHLRRMIQQVLPYGCMLLCLTSCQNPPYPRGSLAALYPTGPRPILASAQVEGRRIATATMAGLGVPDVFFIHGSPGDWQAWATYLNDPQLADLGTRIAVDRPGYGGSSQNGVMPVLKQQAALLAQLMTANRQTIVVGHSLGGPLAAWLAIDYPDRVCGIVLLAASMAPEYEAPRWYNKAAALRPIQWLIPDEMMRSNFEIMPLQQELIKLDNVLPTLHRPVIALQGSKDELVDPRTVDHLAQHIAAPYLTVIRIPDVGHFIPWQKHQQVVDAIHAMAAQCRANNKLSSESSINLEQ
jgi:uncharacterized protein